MQDLNQDSGVAHFCLDRMYATVQGKGNRGWSLPGDAVFRMMPELVEGGMWAIPCLSLALARHDTGSRCPAPGLGCVVCQLIENATICTHMQNGPSSYQEPVPKVVSRNCRDHKQIGGSPFFRFPDGNMVQRPRCAYSCFPWHGRSMSRAGPLVRYRSIGPLDIPSPPKGERHDLGNRAGSVSATHTQRHGRYALHVSDSPVCTISPSR